MDCDFLEEATTVGIEQLLKNSVFDNANEYKSLIDEFSRLNAVGCYSQNGSFNKDKLHIQDVMSSAYNDLRYIIQLGKKIPGFSNLCSVDQLMLVRGSFMDLSVLRLAYRSRYCKPNHLRFTYEMELEAKAVCELGFCEVLVNATLLYAEKLKSLEIDDLEFNLLVAVVLTYPETAGIRDREAVNKLQSRFLDLMRIYCSATPNKLGSRRVGRILLILPSLRTLSVKAAERFINLLMVERKLALDPLLSQLLTMDPADTDISRVIGEEGGASGHGQAQTSSASSTDTGPFTSSTATATSGSATGGDYSPLRSAAGPSWGRSATSGDDSGLSNESSSSGSPVVVIAGDHDHQDRHHIPIVNITREQQQNALDAYNELFSTPEPSSSNDDDVIIIDGPHSSSGCSNKHRSVRPPPASTAATTCAAASSQSAGRRRQPPTAAIGQNRLSSDLPDILKH